MNSATSQSRADARSRKHKSKRAKSRVDDGSDDESLSGEEEIGDPCDDVGDSCDDVDESDEVGVDGESTGDEEDDGGVKIPGGMGDGSRGDRGD